MPESTVLPFYNRLKKNHRHLRKWLKRQQISCYRLYDRDIPEFPLSIDVYEQHLYVCVYQRKHTMGQEEYKRWLEACIQTATELVGIPIEQVAVKIRAQKKGSTQYERLQQSKQFFIVEENALKFKVNLTDYLDTGLFLDHRQTRMMVQQAAKGKRVLNLFAYTASFTVYAAAGGALETTSVDLSKTYLRWAKDNLELNGLLSKKHQFIQADVLQYLQQLPENQQFDLIIVDPPTFSNSKRMKGVFDVQQAHVDMLNKLLKHTSPNGMIYFSTNYRRFKLEAEAIKARQIKNISTQTLPMDFRNKKIHQCFLLLP